MEKAIVIIPARYASTRFPGKPLARLGGREIILRVCDRVSQTGIRSVVATDDDRIYRLVDSAGYGVEMTGTHHRSGTDRVCEAFIHVCDKDPSMADAVIVNVQGDEPFVNPEDIRGLVAAFTDPSVDIATLVTPYPSSASWEGLEDPNLVKVEINARGEAMTFSRSVIPYLRGVDTVLWPASHRYFTHVGVYAYRARVLTEITRLPAGGLESCESLEQLRWLQSGYRIATVMTERRSIGIDTPEDLEAAAKLLKE